MPNRKTFDEREKYDHSGRSLEHRQRNDLQPDVSEEGDSKSGGGPAKSAAAPPRAVPGRTKTGRR
jgi:hypothetical protein